MDGTINLHICNSLRIRTERAHCTALHSLNKCYFNANSSDSHSVFFCCVQIEWRWKEIDGERMNIRTNSSYHSNVMHAHKSENIWCLVASNEWRQRNLKSDKNWSSQRSLRYFHSTNFYSLVSKKVLFEFQISSSKNGVYQVFRCFGACTVHCAWFWCQTTREIPVEGSFVCMAKWIRKRGCNENRTISTGEQFTAGLRCVEKQAVYNRSQVRISTLHQ